MHHEDYEQALKLACDIHKKFQSQINTSSKDRKLAVYYLQGGALTQAYIALKNWSYGDLNGVYRAQRFIAETNNVLEFLSVKDDVSRELKNFFDGGYIEIPNLDNKKRAGLKNKILYVRGHDEETHKKFLKSQKMLTEEFSKGGHPTLYSSAYNSDKETGEFDYDLSDKEFQYYPIRNFDFANFIIIPAANSVYVYSQMFAIEDSYLEKLGEAISHIQALAIKYHNLRKNR